MRAVVITDVYKNLNFGEIVEIDYLSSTKLYIKGHDRMYPPRTCAYVDDEGNPLHIQDAVKLLRGKDGRRKEKNSND